MQNTLAGELRNCMEKRSRETALSLSLWAYGVVVSMFDFHSSDRGSNPGCGGEKFHNVYDYTHGVI